METQVEIKNPFTLKHAAPVVEGQVSRTVLASNGNGIVQVLTFAANAGLSTHVANAPAVVVVVRGRVFFTIDGKAQEMKAGDAIVLPADVEHSVSAPEEAQIVLTKLGA